MKGSRRSRAVGPRSTGGGRPPGPTPPGAKLRAPAGRPPPRDAAGPPTRGRSRRTMKRLAWLTDVHLNFVPRDRIDALCRDIAAAGADAVLLGGDIAEAPDVVE